MSQAHLCHDVMHATIELEQLDRYVSRSRTQALYEAAQQEIAQTMGVENEDDLNADAGLEWGEIYDADDSGYDPLFAMGMPMEPETAEDREVTVYRFGRRLSGVSWSLRGPIALVQYDKVLEQRRTCKKHMELIWKAHGWTGTEPVTRHEARLKRSAIRDLRIEGISGPVLDDPLVFLEHLPEVFATVVGQPQECPDSVEVAWIRRVVPTEDANRSRWPTDPTWRVIQQASFTISPAPVRRLIKREQRAGDIDRRIKVMYGAMVSAVALGHPEAGTWDVSKGLGMLASQLLDEATKPGKEFGQLVRERRQRWGLPVQLEEKILPFRTERQATLGADEVGFLDMPPSDGVHHDLWCIAQAERRLLEALDALDRGDLSPGEQRRLEQASRYESQALSAAIAAMTS